MEKIKERISHDIYGNNAFCPILSSATALCGTGHQFLGIRKKCPIPSTSDMIDSDGVSVFPRLYYWIDFTERFHIHHLQWFSLEHSLYTGIPASRMTGRMRFGDHFNQSSPERYDSPLSTAHAFSPRPRH